MRSQIILISVLIFSLMQCDQVPTTADDQPYIEETGSLDFKATITRFEFDYHYKQFFFTVQVNSPDSIDLVSLALGSPSVHPDPIILNDAGLEGDIITGDGNYDGNWAFPDTLLNLPDTLLLEKVEELWNIQVTVRDINSQETSAQGSLQPQVPLAPVIENVVHLDTLTLLSDALVLDTLKVKITHEQGLDEIRSVSMWSQKPDSTWANDSTAIPLYDDGGSVVFYSFGGIDFTSGDSLANDGIYSLLLALAPNNLAGTYHWTFKATSWLGIHAEPLLDSIVVLPAASQTGTILTRTTSKGVFE